MPNPNKTVAAFRRKNPFPLKESKPTPFVDWVLAQANKGVSYATIADAEKDFEMQEKSHKGEQS